MKNILKILSYFVLSINFLNATSICSSSYKCIVVGDVDNGYSTNLTCTIPAIPNLRINAKNVLDGEGNPKLYWESKTVCDVLAWMNASVYLIDPNYNNLRANGKY